MQKPDRPDDDIARVKTLKSLDLLDTDRDERFDRITRLAMHIFDVPIALVSLVDENRQWFKSCYGLSETETDRDVSFCGHAILGNDAFVINDTHQDPRFADNPLVLGEPYIRFYAGYPIKYTDMAKIGTLCLLSTGPRHFSQREKLILQNLAQILEHEIHTLQLATVDELTEIFNRRGFLISANHALNLCRRQQLPVSLVFFDLDKFKQINDSYGHAEGDKALKFFAAALRDVCRQTDISARLGGDEFALLLSNTAHAEAQKILVRFDELIGKNNQSKSHDFNIEFSYGVTVFDENKHEGIEELIAEGDQLMYQRKPRRGS